MDTKAKKVTKEMSLCSLCCSLTVERERERELSMHKPNSTIKCEGRNLITFIKVHLLI